MTGIGESSRLPTIVSPRSPLDSDGYLTEFQVEG